MTTASSDAATITMEHRGCGTTSATGIFTLSIARESFVIRTPIAHVLLERVTVAYVAAAIFTNILGGKGAVLIDTRLWNDGVKYWHIPRGHKLWAFISPTRWARNHNAIFCKNLYRFP